MQQPGEDGQRPDVVTAEAEDFQPYVPAAKEPREFTLPAIVVGSILGIVFGASSMYLVLKVGLTVSASIPVAVLSITLFRAFSWALGAKPATILENNIVQTAGSAGESIAFGVGVTMPALLILGFDMSLGRIAVVAVLGGLLGILMMIPLRRAFIVQQHRKLAYPEGTACAEVLIAGEEGGASAGKVFFGFGVAFLYKFVSSGMHFFGEAVAAPIRTLKGAVVASEVAPELLGVGYIIGPRIASIMVAGGVLAYLVLVPAIVLFAGSQAAPIFPGTKLIADMSPREIRDAYILYIGAGAVAAGGIISMVRVLPTIFRSARASLIDIRRGGPSEAARSPANVPRTERDLSMKVVLGGSLLLVLAIVLAPEIGVSLLPPLMQDPFGAVLGAVLIVFCGFLFVTVSSRLTGEIGSSSNPISGMTVATLLITCLVFLLLGRTTPADRMAALSIAAVVCIAASNGGTTSQDLKTGFLVGATPRHQQVAILIGALASALVIGSILKALNDAGTVYSQKDLPAVKVEASELADAPREGVRGSAAASDTALYRVWHAFPGNAQGVLPGKYLVDDTGAIRYLVDPAINGRLSQRDDGTAVRKFEAPKTQLMALIIDGVLTQKLPWALVLLGVLIAVTLELSGVPALPFAVGVYLPLASSAPIFLGGAIRWLVDRRSVARTGKPEPDSGPGVLLSTGLIAGGTIAGVVLAFCAFSEGLVETLNVGKRLELDWDERNLPALIAFGLLAALLLWSGLGRVPAGPGNGRRENAK